MAELFGGQIHNKELKNHDAPTVCSKAFKEGLTVDYMWVSNWLNEKDKTFEFETEFAKTLKL